MSVQDTYLFAVDDGLNESPSEKEGKFRARI